jgi:hypothetical protein
MKTSFVMIAFYYLSLANGFGPGLKTTSVTKSWSTTLLSSMRIERKRTPPSNSYPLPRRKRLSKKKCDHVLTNVYLNSINKPSLRSRWYAYWKELQARGVVKILANSLLAYLFIGSTSRCIVFSCAWFLLSKQVRFSLPALGFYSFHFLGETHGMHSISHSVLSIIRPASPHWRPVNGKPFLMFIVKPLSILMVFLLSCCTWHDVLCELPWR